MPIDAERDADMAMPQNLLYNVSRNAHSQQNSGRAMPQVVKTHLREPGVLQQPLKHFLNVLCQELLPALNHTLALTQGMPG